MSNIISINDLPAPELDVYARLSENQLLCREHPEQGLFIAEGAKIIHRAFELGVIMISLRGNILRFQPPLVITTAQLEQAFAILEQVFSEEAAGKLQLPKNAAELGW